MKSFQIIAIFAAVLVACGQQGASDTQQNLTAELTEVLAADASGNGAPGCLIPYQPKICELIDAPTIAQILGVEASQMKVEGDAMKRLHEMGKNKDKPYKGSDYNSCGYVWTDPSGKTFKKEIPQLGRTLDMPIGINISVGDVAPVKDINQFKAEYRPLTQAELDEINNTAGKEMDKRVEQGKNTQSQVDMAKDLAKSFMKGRDLAYVEGIGEAAARIYTKLTEDGMELVVYQNKNRFTVNVTMDTKTKEENLAVAKKIALEVLKKCK